MDFALNQEQQQIRDSILKLCARFDDAYWLEQGQDRRFPARTACGAGRCRLARHRDADRIRRRRARHHRSRHHDAGDRRVGRGDERRLGGPHQYLRAASGRGVRHRRAEAPHAAAADRRPGQGLLRRHRAEHRARHHAAQGARRAPRRPLSPVRPENLDLDRAGRQQDADPRPHHAARRGQAQDRGPEPVLHRPRPQPCVDPRDREDGPPRGRFERDVLRRHGGAGGRPHRRGGRGLPLPSCTA